MSQKFHNGGRTYRTGKGETDAELSARLAAAREREALHGYAQPMKYSAASSRFTSRTRLCDSPAGRPFPYRTVDPMR